MNDHPALAQVRTRTSPRPDAVARVRARLDVVLTPATRELSDLPGPTPEAVERVQARLRARTAGRRSRRTPAVLAAGTLLLGAGAFAAWLARPPAPLPRIDQPLASSPEPVVLAPGVTVTAEGTGHAVGTPQWLTIRWESGRLALDTSVPVQILTPEGTVELEQGALVLTRDALGTRVDPGSSTPTVRCAEGGPDECWPTTAAGWLARGQALGTPAEALEALDIALARAPSPELTAEIHTARIGPLLALDRSDDALRAAEAGLAVPGPRTEALHRTAARLLLTRGDCEAALPHLRALSAPTKVEQAHLDRCAQP